MPQALSEEKDVQAWVPGDPTEKRGTGGPMEVQVEVQFTVQHTLDQLKAEFVKKGHIPAWKTPDDGGAPDLFFESKVVSLTLSTEKDRQAWFVFSLEATGELRKRVVIPNVIPATAHVDIPDLEDFLDFCRGCIVGTIGEG
jgi:hypothetical protein